AFVHCNHLASRVVPGAVADPIARIHGARSLRAQVGVPHGSAPSRRRRQLLAVRVRAGETTIVGAITFADTGDEKAHWLLRAASAAATLSAATGGGRTAAASLPATGTALCERGRHRERRQRERRKSLSRLTHRASPSDFVKTFLDRLGCCGGEKQKNSPGFSSSYWTRASTAAAAATAPPSERTIA